jgi:hypothetical protein
MSDHEWRDADDIVPTAIEHHCEELIVGGRLEQRYNYLLYQFEYGNTRFLARAYLDELGTVSVHGPTDMNTKEPIQGDVDPKVLAYLRRRYRKVKRFLDGSYVPISD